MFREVLESLRSPTRAEARVRSFNSIQTEMFPCPAHIATTGFYPDLRMSYFQSSPSRSIVTSLYWSCSPFVL